MLSFASPAPLAVSERLMCPMRSGGRSIVAKCVICMPLCDESVRSSWCEAMS